MNSRFSVDVVGQVALGHAGRPALAESEPSEHRLDVDLGRGCLECDVAGREPHVLVARFGFPAGFVAAVGFEQPATEVVERGSADVLDEEALQVARLEQADVGAVALHGADAGERGDQWLGHTSAEQESGLGQVGEVVAPDLHRHLDDGLTEVLDVALLPGLDGRDSMLRSW